MAPDLASLARAPRRAASARRVCLRIGDLGREAGDSGGGRRGPRSDRPDPSARPPLRTAPNLAGLLTLLSLPICSLLTLSGYISTELFGGDLGGCSRSMQLIGCCMQQVRTLSCSCKSNGSPIYYMTSPSTASNSALYLKEVVFSDVVHDTGSYYKTLFSITT